MNNSEISMIGGCLCGSIRYQITGDPIFVSQCCCKDCQKATGTGHTTIIGIHKDQLRLEGDLKIYTNPGDSGGMVNRHFCENCGGRIYTSGDAPGAIVMVQAGSLDNPNLISPQSVIYTKSAAMWDKFDPDLPSYPVMPDNPGDL